MLLVSDSDHFQTRPFLLLTTLSPCFRHEQTYDKCCLTAPLVALVRLVFLALLRLQRRPLIHNLLSKLFLKAGMYNIR